MPSDKRRRLRAAGLLLASNRLQLWLNAVLGVLFLALIPVALVTGLKRSVPFLVAISLWALVAAHWSASLAAAAAIEAVKASESTDQPAP